MIDKTPESPTYRGGNAVLDVLPAADRKELAGLSVVRAEATDLLVADGASIETVAFPIDALFSVTARLGDGRAFEVGTIGRDGVVGGDAAFGARTSGRAVICQIEGSYAALPRATFLGLVDREPAFRKAQYTAHLAQVFGVEQTVACNTAHDIGERAARWILTIAEQVGREEFRLRAEFLAMMLAVENRSVLRGIGSIGETGAVRYTDETIAILDREALAESACECYGTQRWYRQRIMSSHDGTMDSRR